MQVGVGLSSGVGGRYERVQVEVTRSIKLPNKKINKKICKNRLQLNTGRFPSH